MDNGVERFVNEEHMSLFAHLFGHEVDPARRQVLRELLATEEHRLGAQSWHPDLVEQHIDKVNSNIERQQPLIADGQMGDLELRQANLQLANYSELYGLLRGFRSFIVQPMARGAI